MESTRKNGTIILLNPNSNKKMTESLKTKFLDYVNSQDFDLQTLTTDTTSPNSINDAADIASSVTAVRTIYPPEDFRATETFKPIGLIVACFSVHPIVKLYRPHMPTIGIFEAGIQAAERIYQDSGQRWAIITTGKFWVDHLAQGVEAELGKTEGFAGVFPTGFTGQQLHSECPGSVETIAVVIKSILETGAKTIVLGCAGLAEMEKLIKMGMALLVPQKEKEYFVIDGVKAAIESLMDRKHRLDKDKSIYDAKLT